MVPPGINRPVTEKPARISLVRIDALRFRDPVLNMTYQEGKSDRKEWLVQGRDTFSAVFKDGGSASEPVTLSASGEGDKLYRVIVEVVEVVPFGGGMAPLLQPGLTPHNYG